MKMQLIGLLLLMQLNCVIGQTRNSATQPLQTPTDCICNSSEPVCSCTFVIEHRLTMILEKEKQLVYPDSGVLRFSGGKNKNEKLTEEQSQRVITADGAGSRLVIAINGMFPGPRIEVFEDQTLNLTVINSLHTDVVTIHFHGIHQKGTPWMDGVAFVTQCPILPGQTFSYRFKAFPPGTNFYHAHIGDQRSMGLYGPLIVRKRTQPSEFQDNEIVVTLQDWNHMMDADTAYHRMITEQFDFNTSEVIDTTYSVDRGNFSRFEFQSGLVNGKGRYWTSSISHNGAPIERFKVKSGTIYRFRVIGAMSLYPMRVYIQGEKIVLRGSDSFNIEKRTVQSIIIHPGERYDFLWTCPGEPKTKEIFLIAETIETSKSLKHAKYHAAEAVLEITDFTRSNATVNPENDKTETCTETNHCLTFNCPYKYYPKGEHRDCLHLNDVYNVDHIRNHEKISSKRVDAEHFINFGFPGPACSPGSINGRRFISPTSPLLTQGNTGITECNEKKCNEMGICKCTYIKRIASEQVIQMVFLNLGSGSGWSHPVHLHGHSFYVMKIGFGSYNAETGVLEKNSEDIVCVDDFGYCSEATWSNQIWAGGNIPDMNDVPLEKDTVVVPTGGYVVIRFVADNPGMWLLHCHIDFHNTNGMAMVIDEGDNKPRSPTGFPVCGNFLYESDAGNFTDIEDLHECNSYNAATVALGILLGIVLLALVALLVLCKRTRKSENSPTFDNPDYHLGPDNSSPIKQIRNDK